MKTDEEDRWTAVASESHRLVRAGRWDEAETLARSLPAPEGLAPTGFLQAKALAFIALGTALLQAGDRDKGAAVLAEAEALARGLRRGANWEEARALFDVGRAWRDAGDTPQALRLWDASVAAVDGRDTARLLVALYRESRTMVLWDRGQRVLGLLPRCSVSPPDQKPKPGYDSR